MLAFANCAFKFCAIATDVAHPVLVTNVLKVTPDDLPAAARYSLAFARSYLGHGRAFTSERYAGLVIGPVTCP